MNGKNFALMISAIGLFIAVGLQQACALQTGDTMLLSFKGKFIISTPCTVSDDEVRNIAFGNIGINEVNGIDNMQPIPFTVDCHGAPDNSPLDLYIVAVTPAYDDTAITTTAEGLAIQIQANGQRMKINKPLSTTVGDIKTLSLTAVPVKDPLVSLTEQTFTATATLTAQYQ
ncbi:fimbrial protein [Atlantibacter sp. RC6]|uniref:fimbrial protein n=1 Tax=Atlantibacter sp. RC6 TaxID=2587036 RepID=UPI00184267D6|nr:fimbrial protein [Atlantibacter sp. RC6]MBB3320761.1 hypothetical protein [Atlantibacter sp. RC6]